MISRGYHCHGVVSVLTVVAAVWFVYVYQGASDYITATSENIFQITSLDPMSNDAAWFRCKCVSTGLIQLQYSDVFSRDGAAVQSDMGATAVAMTPQRLPSVQHLHIFVELGSHNQRQQVRAIMRLR
eukprot:COSAG05_NODE_619_length_8315_cov_5.484421_4_plen_127_part_00